MRERMDLPWFMKINQQQLYEHVSTSGSGKHAWRSSFQHIQAREIQTDTSSNHCLLAMLHSKGGDGCGGGGRGGVGSGGGLHDTHDSTQEGRWLFSCDPVKQCLKLFAPCSAAAAVSPNMRTQWCQDMAGASDPVNTWPALQTQFRL